MEEEEQFFYTSLQEGGDRYKNPRFIAKGGEKTISKVFDVQTGRDVAMAKLHANAPESKFEPFLREARLTSLLDHPNIISIFDIGLAENGRPYFTMELKKGDDLRDIISRQHKLGEGEFDLNYLLEIYLKVCDAISYAHSRDVIHLDLKPDNIQVGKFGDVIVCDWGLGKVIGDSLFDQETDSVSLEADLLNNQTLTGLVKGTPGYMAPEQILKEGVKDVRTDIYALGALLYSLLTDSKPIDAEVMGILKKTIKGEVKDPKSRFKQKYIPEGLNAVVVKAMSLDPDDRYQSVEALRRELRSFMGGFATLAEEASFIKSVTLLYKRNKVTMNLCIIFFVTISVIIWFSMSRLERRTEQAENALLKFQNEERRAQGIDIHKAIFKQKPRLFAKYKGFYQNPVEWLGESLERKGLKDDFYLRQELNFIALDIKGMLAYYKSKGTDNKSNKRFKLYTKLDSCKRVENGRLPVPRLVELLQNPLISSKYHCEALVVYDSCLRKDFTGYEKVILELLTIWNEGLEKSSFSYDAKTASLKLNGPDYKVLGDEKMEPGQKSFIAHIPVKSLDIRHTSVSDLKQLRGLNILESIDLRDTLVSSLLPLNELTSLKKVIISEDQFPKEVIEELDESIELDVRARE